MELKVHSIQEDVAKARLTDGQPAPDVGAVFGLSLWAASTSSYYLVSSVTGREVTLHWRNTWNSQEGRDIHFKPLLVGKTLTSVE